MFNWFKKRKQQPEKVEDYPDYYGWRNHVGYSDEELRAMYDYRNELVIPAIRRVLDAFLGPKYHTAVCHQGIHYDTIEIVENYGDKYIVGHITIRGHSSITNFEFWSSGPRVKCPKCGIITRIQMMEYHECGKEPFGEVNTQVQPKTQGIENCVSQIDDKLYEIRNLCKQLGTLEGFSDGEGI